MAFNVGNSAVKRLETEIQFSCARESYSKTFRKTSYTAFSWSRKTIRNIVFSWHLLLVILWEDAWEMQRSRARENLRKTFRKTGYSLVFSWCWITCDEHRAFLEFSRERAMKLPSVSRYSKTSIMLNFSVTHHF